MSGEKNSGTETEQTQYTELLKIDKNKLTINNLLELAYFHKKAQKERKYEKTKSEIFNATYQNPQKLNILITELKKEKYDTGSLKTDLDNEFKLYLASAEQTRNNVVANFDILLNHYESKITPLQEAVNSVAPKDTTDFDAKKKAYESAKKEHNRLVTSLKNCAYMTGVVITKLDANGNKITVRLGSNDESKLKDEIDRTYAEFKAAEKEYASHPKAKLELYEEKKKIITQAKNHLNPKTAEININTFEKVLDFQKKSYRCKNELDKGKDTLLKDADSREIKVLCCVAAGFTVVGLFVMAGLSAYSKATKGTWDFLAPKSATAVETAKDLNITSSNHFLNQ